jgi:ferrochelatase
MSALPVESTSPDELRPPRAMTTRRVAIVLFNLGGPDRLEAARPFLFNLFNDPAIVAVRQPFRWLLAQLISRGRAAAARKNYAQMGGASPILAQTSAQADALEKEIARRVDNVTFKCFVAMRYWRPFVVQAAKDAEDWGATDAILLPLYPQFSSSTTASSLEAWKQASTLPASAICCYPVAETFAAAHAQAIMDAWRKGGSPASPRVLFSAHGLPERTIARGDPYQWQVEKTVEAVRRLLPHTWDSMICYQSRVGPLKWIGPSTPDEIRRAARDGVGVVASPIAFVSEHVETLVELDIEYAQLAAAEQLPFFLRAKALGTAPGFIDTLAELTVAALSRRGQVQSAHGVRLCPAEFGLCPQRGN